jgi:glycerol kinase
MSNSNITMQTQADILGIPIERPAMRETTALGAAIAAGFAVDIWKEFDELKSINKEDRTIFKPQISKKKSDTMFRHWSHAVEMSKGWVRETEEEDDEEVGGQPAEKKGDEEKKE